MARDADAVDHQAEASGAWGEGEGPCDEGLAEDVAARLLRLCARRRLASPTPRAPARALGTRVISRH
eukprot:2118088-Prymnesium_polylepis.1